MFYGNKVLPSPRWLSADPLLPQFQLDLQRIWQAIIHSEISPNR
jgi:hypothetical protein